MGASKESKKLGGIIGKASPTSGEGGTLQFRKFNLGRLRREELKLSKGAGPTFQKDQNCHSVGFRGERDT